MKKLDRFILRDIISDGAAGTVYLAEEELPGDNRRKVALKVLPPIVSEDKVREERFFNEIKVLAQLAVHPHIVTIYAMGVTEGYPWLAMEYAEGTLEQKIGEAPGSPAEVLKVLQHVGRGLAAMHALNPPLIHQDMKPANILMDVVGHYKVTDFSLATVVAANRTRGLATVRYAAPELLSSEFGKVGPATDLYSLGHVAYELALGGRAYRQQFPAVFEGNASKEPPPNKWMMWHASINTKPAMVTEVRRDFPGGLSDVIAKLMAKPQPLRYATAEELLSDLAVVRQQAWQGSGARSAPAAAGGATKAAPPPPPAAEEPTEEATPAVEVKPAAAAKTEPKAAPKAATMTRYWVRLRGRVSGPFDLPTLQRQIRQGQLSRLHQVSSDQVTWKSAGDVEGLYGPTIV